MRGSAFIVRFVILLLVQIVLAKFVQIGPFLYLTILPAMMLCINCSRKPWTIMLVAFVSGMLVDGLSDGIFGLNAAAAVLSAAMQRPLLRFFLGEEIVERGNSISFRRYGTAKILAMIFTSTFLFFLFYVILDCAGTRSFLFCIGKILLSTLSSSLLQLCVVSVLCPYQKQ